MLDVVCDIFSIVQIMGFPRQTYHRARIKEIELGVAVVFLDKVIIHSSKH